MYEFTPEMGEISGFGGGYEEACRTMLKGACEWLDSHPDADPRFHSYQNIEGVISEDNQDAKSLSKATTKLVDDCSGAMKQATISAALWIHKNGWDAYVTKMSKRQKERNGK